MSLLNPDFNQLKLKEFLDEKKRTLSEAIEAGKIAMQEEREALAHKLEEKD